MKHLILLLLVLTGCPKTVDPIPEPQPIKDTDMCDAAGARLEKLGCADRTGQPMWINKKEVPFGETCREAQDSGGIFLDPRCITAAPSCEEANKCPTL